MSCFVILYSGYAQMNHMSIPSAETYCDITVAIAAPFIAISRNMTNTRSKAIFRITDIPRKISGTAEFPIPRMMFEMQLYMYDAKNPANT